MAHLVRKLKAEVARKYELGTHHTVIIHPKHGHIDLCEVSLEQANMYVAGGSFPYLVLKPKASRKKN